MAIMKEPNDTVFQKTLACSDFYFGADDWSIRWVSSRCARPRTRPDPRRGAA